MTTRFGGLGRAGRTANRLRLRGLDGARTMTITKCLSDLGHLPMTTMMSDIRPIDSSASGDGHGAAVTAKPGHEMTPDQRQGKIDRSVAELGEMLKGAVRDLGAVALEAEKLRLGMAELRGVLAEIRRQYSRHRCQDEGQEAE